MEMLCGPGCPGPKESTSTVRFVRLSVHNKGHISATSAGQRGVVFFSSLFPNGCEGQHGSETDRRRDAGPTIAFFSPLRRDGPSITCSCPLAPHTAAILAIGRSSLQANPTKHLLDAHQLEIPGPSRNITSPRVCARLKQACCPPAQSQPPPKKMRVMPCLVVPGGQGTQGHVN